MINIKNVTMKNFLSVGNNTQAIVLGDAALTLVLGENIDQGSSGSRNGVGKAQPLHSKILTPNGWTTMGEIKIGDVVSTPSGETTVVSGVFPQGLKSIYRITLSDGRTLESCDEHLFKAFGRWQWNKPFHWKVVSLSEIMNKMKKDKWVSLPHAIATKSEKDFVLDPYLIGALLGDGCLTQGIGFTSKDVELVVKLNSLLPKGYEFIKKPQNKYDYVLKGAESYKGNYRNRIKDIIHTELGLKGNSYSKFIPEIYKNGSIRQRLSLIQGLLDTDGYVGKNGVVQFSTTSKQLALDLQEVIRSVGGQAKLSSGPGNFYTYKGVKKQGQPTYGLSIRYPNPKDLVWLPRKRDRLSDNYQYNDLKLRITNIEFVGNLPAQCIMVDNSEHLYVTDNYVATHNTTMVQAISFAIFGQPLTNIKKDNLINKTNGKGMAVTLEYSVDGKNYRIERGRKPNFLRYYVNDDLVNAPDSDEAHGESKITQEEIQKVFGMSHALFKHLVALHTKTTPFLSESANKQREIIEELISITQLSEKAEMLKNVIKEIKDEIRNEEIRIKTITEGNERVQKTISDLNFKSNIWDREQKKRLESLATALVQLEQINIDEEIESHKTVKQWDEVNAELQVLDRENTRMQRAMLGFESNLVKKERSLTDALDQKCPMCQQGLHGDHDHIAEQIKIEIEEIKKELESVRTEQTVVEQGLVELAQVLEAMGDRPQTFYRSVEQAYEHRSQLDKLRNDLERESQVDNPFVDQIANLSTSALQEISYDYINELTTMKEHQDFLLKLLVSKDSFIRKKIIDQNLAYLNFRLGHYLSKLQLPHEVEFKSDLSVEITQLGRDFDFEQLSNGEQNRLILSLAWAFRDVWESMNHKLNLLIIDELVDSGMDGSGTDSALDILKEMCRTNGKSIFLISHKDGLETRVDRVAVVQKENNFTTYVSFTDDM